MSGTVDDHDTLSGPEEPDGTAAPEPQAAQSCRHRSGRIRKRILTTLAAILAILVVGLAVLNSPIGHRFVVNQIAKVAPASGLRISIGRIEGSLYGEAVLHDLVLSDPKGAFLRVPRTELDWQPFNWFFKGLDVRNLVAHRGMLLRVPELEPGDPDAPILPNFDIRIDRFELDRLTVSEGILGEARKINLLAKADIRSGRVYLKADGELGGQDKLALLVDAWPDGDRFDLVLDYRAPKGGLLASLAGANSDMRARIVGDGKWSAWNGALLVEQNKARLAAFRLTNKAGRYALLGQFDAEPMLDGLAENTLGKAVSLAAIGTLEDSVLNGSLSLKGRGIGVSGKGAIDLGENAFDAFALRGRLRDPRLFGPDTRLDGAQFTATLDGPFRGLTVPHTISIAEADFGTRLINVQQQGRLGYDGERWTLPLDVTAAKIVTGTDAIDPRLVGGKLTGLLTLSDNTLESDDLKLDFPGLSGRLALRGNLARGSYALAGPIAARGLALENIGEMDANAKILFKIGNRQPWSLRANLAGKMPKVTNETVASIAGKNIRFKGGLLVGANQPILFNDTSLDASKLSLTLDGKVTDGRTTLAGRGRHTEYGPFTVDAAISDAGPQAELVFASPLPAAGLVDVRVALAPIPDGLRIDTRGGSMLGPFDGVLNLYLPTGGPTRLAIEQMKLSRTAISGEVVLGDGGASGKLALAGGGLDGTIGLMSRGGKQGFDLDLRAKNARFDGPEAAAIRSASLQASGVIGSGWPVATGSLYAQGVSYGSLFVGRVAAKANVTDGGGTVTASLSGRRGSSFNLQLEAGITRKQVALVARGDYAGKRISMPRRALLMRDKGGWKLAPTQLSFGDGIVIGEGRFGGSAPNRGTLKMAAMPLSLADVIVADTGLGGRISGELSFEGRRGGPPSGSAQIQVKGLSRSGLVLTSRPIDLYLVADLSENRFETRAVIEEGGERRGRLQGRIARMRSSGGLFERLSAGELSAQLRYDGPADALWRLAAIDAFDLTGPLAVAADVSGTLAEPLVRGSLSSDTLRMRSALTGTDVRGISARGRFSGSLLRLTRFAGKTPNGGTVSGSGTVDLAGVGARGPKIDLRMAAKDAKILNRRDMAATVTGPLRIVSDGNGGTIAGRLKVDNANWRLGNAAGVRELPDIATREINTPPDIAPARVRSKQWRYMIDAKSSSRLFVRGMGMDSEWGADIKLRGTTSDPRIGGRAQVVRGTYEFAGTRFDLARGRISFDLDVPPDPRLDILAETDLDGLEVRVAVKGSAAKPEITFTSTPALPEEELLARLLFGGSIADLSATDALQLGSALASLRGGGGMDPINKLRSAVGLDRLRIVSADPALDRETSVALGKNIGRKFYVEIVTDGRGYSATELEFKVTRWLSLLGAVSTVGRQSIAAEISRDY